LFNEIHSRQGKIFMKKLFLFALPLLFIYLNCEENSPTTPHVGTIPELSQLTAPETLYLISEMNHYISIKAVDPQGIEDIAEVTCNIFFNNNDNPIKNILLEDDGTRGDIIPNDGTFTAGINADSLLKQVGDYSLVFKAEDVSGNESETISHQLTLLDGEENISPAISNLELPLMLDIQDTSDYLMTLKADDPQGLDDIELVLLEIFSPTTSSPVILDTLWDNGENGDVSAGDGIYSQFINIKAFILFQPGKYSFKFQAFDRSGGTSNPIVEIIKITPITNDHPIISNLIAPLTMQVLSDRVATTVLELTVSDPQGLSDIWSVYFNSFKPDGSPSKSNPFKMYDDGDESGHGDRVAEDGIYALRINLPPGTPAGDYKFIFEAEDFLELKSNQIVHVLKVIQ